MISVAVLWVVSSVLSAIIMTALCITCRRRIPVHITETDYYVDKPQYSVPPSSFMIINRPPVLPRSSSSQATMYPQDFLLTIPKSPVPTESRRSSMGREVQGGLNSRNTENEDDDDGIYDDEGGDPNYSKNSLACGYIVVLPDDSDTNPGPPVEVSPSIVDNRASLSSVATDDNYVNVGTSSDSKVTVDDNYVNVGDSSDSKGGSLEYVNVDDAEKLPINHDSEDDDMPDYENVVNGQTD
ncbi:uncharacterized protein LOC134945829 isoform X2 [Pseudophryne corroboree]|uniref:uncharacterized protein LOC134945829 isoform X2 n=1 Tax=Pseudophryne corroboree TaxID=495146 RepID=UPI003081D0CD